MNFIRTKFRMIREETIAALAGFHADPLSWSNLNLEMLEKPSEQDENQQHAAVIYGLKICAVNTRKAREHWFESQRGQRI